MVKNLLWFFLLFTLLITGCNPVQLPESTITESATFPPTTIVTPPAVLTPTAVATPTLEIEQPSVPNGLRPENAASQTLENGVWTVKNADGKVTATWNTETKQWDYVTENMKIEQIIIGYNGDIEAIKPYLGPLPPDDPATHFKNADGTPVGYGIGPEVMLHMQGSVGNITYPAIEVFLRFRGVAPISSESKLSHSAVIFELPRSADTSLILVIDLYNVTFYFDGTIGDKAVWDPRSRIYNTLWIGDSGIKIANDNLIGSPAMVFVAPNMSSQIAPENTLHDYYALSDKFAQALLDYIQGTSTHLPVTIELGQNESIQTRTTFPQTALLNLPNK